MNLGFIGTGNIVTDVVTGISKSKISYKKIVISPRNKRKAQYLKKKFKFTKLDIFLSLSDEKKHSIAFVIINRI